MIHPRSNPAVEFETLSYRHAEEILNSKLAIKKELEQTTASILEVPVKQGPEGLTAAICKSFVSKNWGKEEPVSDKQTHEQRFDLFKDRVAVEIEFSRYEFLYRD